MYIQDEDERSAGITINYPSEDGTLALTSDIPTQKTYYMHTITFTPSGGGTGNTISFMMVSTRSTAYTASVLGGIIFRNKEFVASGYFGTNVVSRIAFTSATQVKLVHGPASSTTAVTISDLTDSITPAI
jgi:hypothetical protein